MLRGLVYLDVYSVEGPCLAGDVSVAGAGVSQKNVAVLLSALTNHNNPSRTIIDKVRKTGRCEGMCWENNTKLIFYVRVSQS